ncbi:protein STRICTOSIDINE SYNTHASE-LIKE 10-like [Diospyros lotus]|uniref:protein STRICTOSIDINE SYNTHASE-LIKE 10-like n=1 Tax=Diospyros lotus TaxID=55363 RepID=UPI002253D6DB|nr:protein STRICTOSIDINE SYNTHASE-LIKE 10-like [Diospyros lotus]
MAPVYSLSKAMGSKLFLTTSATVLLLSAFLSVLDHFSLPSVDEESDLRNVIPIAGAAGPESLAFDPQGGGPYTGVSDGRIIKWLQDERRWIDFAVTSAQREGCEGGGPQHGEHEQRESICGRPLGLGFNKRTGNLFIADAYMGLLVVGPQGGLATPIATEADGVPFGFTNGLDIDQQTGFVYFTDSSSRYRRRNYVSVIARGDSTGRLLKYDPGSGQTTVILGNLTFPNGVALSRDGDFLLVADTTNCRILKVWLQSSNAGRVEVFAGGLPGFPDNIQRNEAGEFWVAIHARRGQLLKWVLSFSRVGRAVVEVSPFDLTKLHSVLGKWSGSGSRLVGVRLSKGGEVVEVVEDGRRNGWKFVSEVKERDGKLWIGSISMPFVGMQEMEKAS